MAWENTPQTFTSERGLRAALIFALAAERLSLYYEHGQWLTDAQGASLCPDWLARTQRSLPQSERKQLSAISDRLARQVAGTLSREAGLYTLHEMMGSLDPNHESEVGRALMEECERMLDEDAD